MKPYYHFCVSTHVSHKKFMKKINNQKTKVEEIKFQDNLLYQAIKSEISESCERSSKEEE